MLMTWQSNLYEQKTFADQDSTINIFIESDYKFIQKKNIQLKNMVALKIDTTQENSSMTSAKTWH